MTKNDTPAGGAQMLLAEHSKDTRKHKIGAYATICWAEICGLVQAPQAALKGRGMIMIPSSYVAQDGRSFSVQREHGKFHLIAFDLDEAVELALIQSVFRSMFPGATWVCYWTSGASNQEPRWRVLLLMAEPIPGSRYQVLNESCIAVLAQHGITADGAMARTAQSVYLPSRPEESEGYAFHIENGTPWAFPAGHPVLVQEAATVAAWAATQRAMVAKRLERARKATAAGRRDVAAWFNAANSIEDCLTKYKYTRAGDSNDWRSPFQKSNGYATRDFGDHWVSLSQSDADAGLGAETSGGGSRFGDAFDFFCCFEHGNNQTRAAAAVHRLMDVAAAVTSPDAGLRAKIKAAAGGTLWGAGETPHDPETGEVLEYDDGGDDVQDDTYDADDAVLDNALAVPSLPPIPGLVGELMDYMADSNRRDIPKDVFCGAALIAVAAASQHHFAIDWSDGPTALNLEVIVQMRSGHGKEAQRQTIALALAATGGSEPVDRAASLQGLHRHMTENRGCATWLVDEFGKLVQRISAGKDPHMDALMEFTMKLYGLALARVSGAPARRAAESLAPIDLPFLNLLATTTDDLAKALTSGDIDGGLLNRKLLFSDLNAYPTKTGGRLRGVPPSVELGLNGLYRIIHTPGLAPTRTRMTQRSGLRDFIPITMTAGAEAAVLNWVKVCDDRIMKMDRQADLWQRAVENMVKVAGVIALGDAASLEGVMGDGDTTLDAISITARHIEVAVSILSHSLSGMEAFVEDGVHDTEVDRQRAKLLTFIRKAGSAGVLKRDISRNVRGFHQRDRDDLLSDLVEAELVRAEATTNSTGRPGIRYFAIRQRR